MVLVGAAAFLVAQAASLLGARALLGWVRTGDGAVDFLQFLLLRLLLISATVLVAGLAGMLDLVSLGLLAVAVLALLTAGGAHRGLARPRLPDASPWVRVVAAAVALRLMLQVWFFAPHLGDAVAYHLPKVAEWVRAGGFTTEMGLHPHVTFPAGFELVETWWVVFLRHDVLIEAAGVEFVVLAAAAVFVLARRLGLDDRGSSLAALIYVLTPGFHLSATSCLNDAPAAAMALATAALILGQAPWAAVAVAASLGVGIKPTAGFAMIGLPILAWGRPWKPVGREALPAVAAAAVGAFWYVRNFAWFGNPFHPLGSAGVDNPVAVQLGPRIESMSANLRDLMGGRLLDAASATGANVDHGAGWGAAAVAVGLIGLVVRFREDAGLRRTAAAFGLSLLATLVFVQNDPWCLKYAFFFPGVLAVAAAGWATRSRPAAALAALSVSFSLAATMLPYDLPWDRLKELASLPVARRSSLSFWADDVPDAAVGCRGGFSVRSYLLYRPDFSRRVVYLREEDGAGMAEALRANGLSHVYTDRPPTPAGILAPRGRQLYGVPDPATKEP